MELACPDLPRVNIDSAYKRIIKSSNHGELLELRSCILQSKQVDTKQSKAVQKIRLYLRLK